MSLMLSAAQMHSARPASMSRALAASIDVRDASAFCAAVALQQDTSTFVVQTVLLATCYDMLRSLFRLP
eukprot:8464057-Alexandrium_andersonii.AAC.1